MKKWAIILATMAAMGWNTFAKAHAAPSPTPLPFSYSLIDAQVAPGEAALKIRFSDSSGCDYSSDDIIVEYDESRPDREGIVLLLKDQGICAPDLFARDIELYIDLNAARIGKKRVAVEIPVQFRPVSR